MKKRITNLMALCTLISFGVTAQIQTPAPSPAGSVSSTVGLTDVTIDYFRPGKKGRKIFGEGSDFLVPYGQVWRTGANAGTILALSSDVKIGGKDVKAGEYQIVSKPGASSWEIMLLTDKIGGNMNNYKEDIVAAKVSVPSMKNGASVERMTFQVANISEDNTKADIQFTWENTMVNIPVEVDYDAAVMADIAAKTQVAPGNYVTAASYYLSSGKDLKQALEWMNMYLAVGENSNQFWNVHTKAQILAKLGMKKEALATAEESLMNAKSNDGGDFGYIKRNEDLIAEVKSK
ncbi:MAG: DUF2911 domain-containing protein [Cyclobacteriaceae bacterium]